MHLEKVFEQLDDNIWDLGKFLKIDYEKFKRELIRKKESELLKEYEKEKSTWSRKDQKSYSFEEWIEDSELYQIELGNKVIKDFEEWVKEETLGANAWQLADFLRDNKWSWKVHEVVHGLHMISSMKTGNAKMHKSGSMIFFGKETNPEIKKFLINTLDKALFPNTKIPRITMINVLDDSWYSRSHKQRGAYHHQEDKKFAVRLDIYQTPSGRRNFPSLLDETKGVISHEIGHHVFRHLPKEVKTKWQKKVGELRKTNTARLISWYIGQLDDENSKETIIREEVFTELRNMQTSEPEKFDRMSKGKFSFSRDEARILTKAQKQQIIDLIKLYHEIGKAEGKESFIDKGKLTESKENMLGMFLYDENNQPTNKRSNAVRASVYTEDGHYSQKFT